jgi:hypothetical protein
MALARGRAALDSQLTQDHTMSATVYQESTPLAEPVLQPAAAQAMQAMQVVPQSNVTTPADLLRIAMQSDDKNLDRLERLMQMQERYEQAQERERLRQAELAFRRDFALFRGENVIIPKTRRVDRGKAGSFDQAEFDVVCRMLSTKLSEHGFGFRHDQKFGSKPWTTDGVISDIPWVTVKCFLEHREGFRETLELEGPAGDLSANTPVQNMQVTASYFKRQSLLALTGTATGGEDDEGRLAKSKAGQLAADAPAVAPASDALLQSGRDASMLGMKALTAWWAALTAAQRESLTADFGAMRKAASAADKMGAAK